MKKRTLGFALAALAAGQLLSEGIDQTALKLKPALEHGGKAAKFTTEQTIRRLVHRPTSSSDKDKQDYDGFLNKLEINKAKRRTHSYPDNKNYLEQNLEEILSFWYGTTWDYNGTTTEPQTGEIACGYLVSTTLEDLGYHINRVKMGQQAASKIIRSVCDPETIEWFSNTAYSVLDSYLEENGEGFYVLGLDNHVGFIQKTADKTHFIHSNSFFPAKVIKERAEYSTPLLGSKVRNIGKLFSQEFVEKYLSEETIRTEH